MPEWKIKECSPHAHIDRSEAKLDFNTKISISGLLHDRVRLDESFPIWAVVRPLEMKTRLDMTLASPLRLPRQHLVEKRLLKGRLKRLKCT